MNRKGLKNGKSRRMTTLRILKRNKGAIVACCILVILTLAAILAPVIAPYNPTKMDIINAFQGPSAQHICGTDDLGRDIFSRLLYGARYSLLLGFVATATSVILGVAIGSISGYFGGSADDVIMRIIDIVQAIPGLLLSICISAALGSGFGNTVLALSIGGCTRFARLTRASVLNIRKMEYLESATAINCSHARIILRHVIPNSLSPIIVSATMNVASMILAAAGLSYIGLGVQPPTPEWGAMLSAGRNYIQNYPYLVIFPGLCIMITVLALNILGDGLRDALDPKQKH